MYSILAQFWRNLCLVFRRRFATGCEIDVKLILSLKIFLKTSAFIFYWRLMYAVHLSWKISHRLKKENKFNGEIWRLLPEILMVMLLHFYKFHLAEEVCWKPVVSIILCFPRTPPDIIANIFQGYDRRGNHYLKVGLTTGWCELLGVSVHLIFQKQTTTHVISNIPKG